MTPQELLAATKSLVVASKVATPELVKLVNVVRGITHLAKELTVDTEAEFHKLIAERRHTGYGAVPVSLAPLPTVAPDGKTVIPPLPAPKAPELTLVTPTPDVVKGTDAAK